MIMRERWLGVDFDILESGWVRDIMRGEGAVVGGWLVG